MNNPKLSKLLKPVAEIDATELIRAKATHYTLHSRVYVPNVPYVKLLNGYEAVSPNGSTSSVDMLNESNHERSIRRTKTKIRDICSVNVFDLFATFTFNAQKNTDSARINTLKYWIKNQKKRIGVFDYLVIAERHKNGNLHFHGLLKDYKGKLTPAMHKGRLIHKKGRQIFNFKSYKSGFSTVAMVDKGLKSQMTLSSYVAKYITKDTPSINGRHRYWASRGLKRPEVEENPIWYNSLDPVHKEINEYGVFYFYPADKVRKARNEAS